MSYSRRKKEKVIGILTGGGDCCGINAVIYSIVKAGSELGYKFIGIRNGFDGFLGSLDYINLDREEVHWISHLGGTILGTVNKGAFTAKVGLGEKRDIPKKLLMKVKKGLDKLNVYALIVIGGDGTLSIAMQLSELGVNIVGVPKTIDNDINLTDRTFGFSTSVNVITDYIDNIHSTASSHNRVFFIETMGRHSGWLALYGGLSGGAKIILLPEIPFQYEKIIEFLRYRKKTNHKSTIACVAEGAAPVKGKKKLVNKSASKESKIGGMSKEIVKTINELAPNEFELRGLVVGHLQRGGRPYAMDRILSFRYGVRAIEAVKRREFNRVICIQNDKIMTVKIKDAVKKVKKVPINNEMIKTARSIGICFGD